MARVTHRAVFNESLLPDGEARWGSFGAGFGIECLALTIILVIPLLMPQKMEMVQRYWTTPIEAPVVEPWKPQPKPVEKPVVKPAPVKVAKVEPKPDPVPVEVPKPKIINPVFSSPVAKPATAKKNTKAPDSPDVAKAYPDQTLPSMGSSAIPTIRKPREEVQTGGFGDPNGVPANGNTSRAPNIAAKGAYDMPTGPGYGNGTGGAKGAKGVVASSGFGNGVATGSGGGSHGRVQSSGFADEATAAPAPKTKPVAASTAKTTPVEILFKPKPVYTDEAKNKKIEGDVLLQVVFTAGGNVQIQRVVQGLGYGLDDSAQAAAKQIRFKPAQQEGQAVDFPAIVHITFALAY